MQTMKSIYKLTLSLVILSLPGLSISQCLEQTHRNEAETSWQSCEMLPSNNPDRGSGHWIMYDFGHVYQIKEAIFWNFNETMELDKGVRRIAVDYSTNGTDWRVLDEFEIGQAPGVFDYEGEPAIDFRGIEMQYVLITALENWGDASCSGFSEIRFNIGSSPTTSVDEEEEIEVEPFAVFAYPNPAEDFLKIVSDNGTIESIQVTDVLGKNLINRQYDGVYNTTIDISSLSSGMYWVQAQGEGQNSKIQFTKVTTE